MKQLTVEQLVRLGLVVEQERLDKGWSKEEAARRAQVSSITWKRVEDGEKVQPIKMRAIERALGWAGGSADTVARGGEPVIDPTASNETSLEQRILEGPFSDEEKVYLMRLVREAREVAG